MAFFNDTCTYHLTKEQIIKKKLSIKTKRSVGMMAQPIRVITVMNQKDPKNLKIEGVYPFKDEGLEKALVDLRVLIEDSLLELEPDTQTFGLDAWQYIEDLISWYEWYCEENHFPLHYRFMISKQTA